MKPEDLLTQHWFYVQAFTGASDHKYWCLKTICFAPTPDKAKEAVTAWVEAMPIEDRNKLEIHLYLKNYKREARFMVQNGNYIIA